MAPVFAAESVDMKAARAFLVKSRKSGNSCPMGPTKLYSGHAKDYSIRCKNSTRTIRRPIVASTSVFEQYNRSQRILVQSKAVPVITASRTTNMVRKSARIIRAEAMKRNATRFQR